MLAAKFAAPYESNMVFRWPAIEQAADRLVTLFVSPPGYLYAGSLAKALKNRGKSLFWLRLGPEDRDPATFLLSLIEGVRHVLPDFGASTLARMQRNPGPVAGWPPLYLHLAEELAGSLPESSAMIFEHAHLLSTSQPTLVSLGTQLLAGLPASIPCVILSHKNLPSESFPAHTIIKETNGLKMDTLAGLSMAEDAKGSLPVPLIHRVLSLMDGRAVPLAGIASASRVLGLDFIQHLVARCRSGDQLLDQVVRAWLSAASPGELRSLSLALDLNYIHPEIAEAVFESPVMPSGPWLQPLNNEWQRIWCVWEAALRSALNLEPFSDPRMMNGVVKFLLTHDAKANAVRMLLEMKDFPDAARVVTDLAEGMMNLGQWSTLEHWLNFLPGQVLYDWPQLIYMQGELAAARGVKNSARRSFATAARRYSERQDHEGASKSLLAEATLAAWDNQPDHARICASMANSLATASKLNWYQGWANWQLGCLAIYSGDIDKALTYFNKASDTIMDPYLSKLFKQVQNLVVHQRELNYQLEFHRQGYNDALQAEKEASTRLKSIISSPVDGLDIVLHNYGWSGTPLLLKMDNQSIKHGEQENTLTGFWYRISNFLNMLYSPNKQASNNSDQDLFSSGFPLPIPQPIDSQYTGPIKFSEDQLIFNVKVNKQVNKLGLSSQGTVEPERFVYSEEESGPSLIIYSLGPFRAFQSDQLIENWTSRKALLVFKYLFTHRKAPVPKDILMDIFWPEADSESARRNLHQAIYALRQILRVKDDEFHYILFENNNYSLNPDLGIWLDYEEFERHDEAGQQLEQENLLKEAIREYWIAEGLYKGNFLEEDLYEDWIQPRRQYLLERYLFIATYLARYHLSCQEYSTAIALSQRILLLDNCQEEAYQISMKCYIDQGHKHLALRQYQLCNEVLRDQLNLTPSPETQELYRLIKET